MKKCIVLITLLTLIEGPLQAEHDWYTTFGEGMFVSAVLCWQIVRALKDKEIQEKEVDPRTTLPCGHDYICPACQVKNEQVAKKSDEGQKEYFRTNKRPSLKRLEAN